MGNAFLKTRVGHAGVAMLPTVTDKPESFRCDHGTPDRLLTLMSDVYLGSAYKLFQQNYTQAN